MRSPRQQGFTLVELSIVLVIVGLILGGVMVGRSMIRSSQVGKIGQDLQAYEAATQMFIDKYQGLPGDMTNATTFWTGAVNGNGDGLINVSDESFRSWQHLTSAGLIKGRFSGVTGSGSVTDFEPGNNVPRGPVSGTGYMLFNLGTVTIGCDWWPYAYRNVLLYGKDSGTSYTYQAILTPAELYAIDLKYDDGKPVTGIVFSGQKACATVNCTTTTDPATTDYNTSYQGEACNLIYRLNV
jgi:prepilin-type N-terminal cleavage/methylation domain-containing protein